MRAELLSGLVLRRLSLVPGAVLGLVRHLMLCAVVLTGLLALRLVLRRARRGGSGVPRPRPMPSPGERPSA